MSGNMWNAFSQNFQTALNWNNFSNFLDSNTSYDNKKLYAKAAVTTISTLSAVKNIATNLKNALPQITYTQGPVLQYAGVSGSFATAGSLTITPGTLSMKEIFGNMSFIAGANGGGTGKVGGSKGDDLVDDINRTVESKPNEMHHFLSNKNSKYTKQFEDIIKKYGLDLDGNWNKGIMPHRGRHPSAYHEYLLDQITKFDNISDGNTSKFLGLFDKIKDKVIENPDMLNKKYWK